MPPSRTVSDTDYRATLNLPSTAFPMQAELPKREPDRVAWWREHAVYEKRLAANAGNPTWILHDGPPYANGEVHMGTFLNRVLKDIFVKVHLLDGRRATFVPGWDMHGLPIEFETLKHLKLDFHKIDPIELRAKCRERALYWLDRQRATFLRMGVLGDYDHPYRTVDKHFEAEIVDTLADLAQAEQMYKGLRATLWCVRDETALAEAEIEYKPRVSPSIYVRFAATAEQRADLVRRFGAADGDVPQRLAVAIWTTTPWTLPANVAIAVKPEATYGLYRVGDEAIVVAEALAATLVATSPELAAALGGASLEDVRLGSARGDELALANVRHPFLDRDSTIVGAEYVELDTGTGAVHTAPGHGADDFDTGTRYGLPTLVPVDGTGHFTHEAGPYAGLQIFEANPQIVADLRASGALIHASEYEHSYPHCWRCKNPVIFRATSQWFIAMDVNRLRKRAEEKVPTVSWVPAWGEERMLKMLENHPEWCISRQRTWGTPIPAVQCVRCRTTVLDPDVARAAAALFREHGADLWWTEPVERFLPERFACENCGNGTFEKEYNIVDIWFESGVTHRVVLGHDAALPWPSDVVLEGADQFRGWFRSSLLTAVASKGAAPYREVVTTGWVVDANGHAMHKSSGNYMAAEGAMNEYGADVLRLWVASVEFNADMRLGKELLKSIQQVYRNFRNRLRWTLGTIEDLTPETLVPEAELQPIDALALAKYRELAARVVEQYERYRLHDVYLALIAFDVEDLSRFYFELLKDPTYSTARDGRRRRSAQTTLFRMLEGMLALYAPLLSFTAEEVWQAVPESLRAGRASVFDLPLPRVHAPAASDLALWASLKALRGTVSASDGMRDFQLAAHVTVPPERGAAFERLGDGLREALVVSSFTLATDSAASEPHVTLSPAAGEKCARCWKWLPHADDPKHPTLCGPCAAIVNDLERDAVAR